MVIDDSVSIYAGQNEVSKVYAGTNVVYEKAPQYTEVNYIQSTGTQYIDTLFPATYKTKIDIDFQYTNATANNQTRIFGSRQDWDKRGFYAGTYSNYMNSNYWFLVGTLVNDRWHSASRTANTSKHNLVLSSVGAYLDNTLIWSPDDTPTAFTPFATIILFGANEGNGGSTPTVAKGVLKIYGCKIYDDNVLVRDFIPVLDSSNVVCMYDKVSKTFYYNAGTGVFLHG